MMNKKAQGLSITTLVVIILAIIILVVLAMGFGLGWANFWSKMTGFFSPVNVDSVKQACQYACTISASNDYCCRVRNLKFAKDVDPKAVTCNSEKAGMLKLDGCDLSCKASDCDVVVCSDFKGADTGEFYTVEGTECLIQSDTIDTTKTLDENLKPLKAQGKICCKTGV